MNSLKREYFILGLIFSSLLGLILFIDCNQAESILSPENGEFFDYTAFNYSGTTVARGWLFLKLEDNLIKGEWEIKRVGKVQNIGPQIGSGTLAGGYKGDSIWVDLQPQMRDNNLLLQGYLRNNTYSGKWIYISFIGPTNNGIFTAEEKL
jgi:hypothetical protein